MKKKILSICVVSALGTLPAVALAEATVYGKAHVSLDSLSDGKDGGQFLSSNSSRLGFKASRELSEGLTGLAQYETGVDLSSSASAWGAGRDSYVGLKGNFGTVLGGRLPAANQWVYDVNYFADQVGDAGNFTGTTGTAAIDTDSGDTGGLPGRADHALHYVLPLGEPVSVGLTYVPAQSTNSDDKASVGVKAGFAQGAIKAGAGYFNFADNHKVATASASYDFGVGSVGAIVVMRDSKNINVTAAPAEGEPPLVDPVTTDTIKSKVTVVSVGAAFNVGTGTAKAQFSSAGASDSGRKDGATMIAVGYDHPLDKSATAYIAYASVSNDKAGTYSPNNWGHGSNPGVGTNAAGESRNPNGLSIGLVVGF